MSPHDLACYLRSLVQAGATTPETEALVALLDASWLVEAGCDPRTTLERVLEDELAEPYASRVAECLAELPAPPADVVATPWAVPSSRRSS